MTKRTNTIMILIISVLLALAVVSIGTTAAIWTSSAPGSGNTVAPATDSPENWNVWAKYFGGEIIDENLHTARLTVFHSDSYGLNLETVIIPNIISIDGKDYKVVEIGNQIFADATLKQLPVKVYISPEVKHISAMAFSNLPNLTKVVFGVDENGQGANCVLDDFTFMMCAELSTVITNGRSVTDTANLPITAAGLAFMGCTSNLTIIENL